VLAVLGLAALAGGAVLGQGEFQVAQVVLGHADEVVIDVPVVREMPERNVGDLRA
jgi:hypothetical protein